MDNSFRGHRDSVRDAKSGTGELATASVEKTLGVQRVLQIPTSRTAKCDTINISIDAVQLEWVAEMLVLGWLLARRSLLPRARRMEENGSLQENLETIQRRV